MPNLTIRRRPTPEFVRWALASGPKTPPPANVPSEVADAVQVVMAHLVDELRRHGAPDLAILALGHDLSLALGDTAPTTADRTWATFDAWAEASNIRFAAEDLDA